VTFPGGMRVRSTIARVACVAFALGMASCGTNPEGPVPVGTRTMRLEKTSGDHQAGVVGQELPGQVEALVIDADGDPVPDQSVSFVVYSGGGSITPAVTRSDENGIVRARWTLGSIPTTAHQVSARLAHPTSGALMDVVTFSATAVAGPATSIAKVSGDQQSGQAGRSLLAPLIVVVTDQFGNPKPAALVLCPRHVQSARDGRETVEVHVSIPPFAQGPPCPARGAAAAPFPEDLWITPAPCATTCSQPRLAPSASSCKRRGFAATSAPPRKAATWRLPLRAAPGAGSCPSASWEVPGGTRRSAVPCRVPGWPCSRR